MGLYLRWLSLALLCLWGGTGCGTLRCHYCVDEPIESTNESERQQVSLEPVIISVRGFGALDPSVSNGTQQKLMGLRASKMDAYRSLAERLRGIQITSNSKVEDFLARYDHLSAVVDAYVSRAKVVSQFVNDMGACETVLSVELDPHFYQIMGNSDKSVPDLQTAVAVGKPIDPKMESNPNSTLSTMSVEQTQNELVEPEDPVEVMLWDD